MVIPLIIQFAGIIKFDNEESYNEAKIWFTILALLFRIVFTIWVVNIANRQNRNSTNWGLFAFFLPSIALIIIGLNNKLRLKVDIDSNLPIPHQISLLLQRANQFYSAKRYFDCIEILNKILGIDTKNSEAIYLRGLSYYSTGHYKNAEKDFEFLKSNEKFTSSANYYLGNIELRNSNLDKAIQYWTVAKEKGNQYALSKLNQNFVYRGKFLLTKEEMKKKLDMDLITMEGIGVNLINAKYLKGIVSIDTSEKDFSKKQSIVANKFGIGLLFRNQRNNLYIGISYNEINDIFYEEEKKKFILQLFDNSVVEIHDEYVSGTYVTNGNEPLKYICKRFEEKTSRQSQASLVL